MKTMFKQFSKRDWIFLSLSFCLILSQVWLELQMPEYMQKITILLQSAGAIGEILINGLYMLLCSLTSFGLSLIVGLFGSQISAGVGLRLRKTIYGHISTFSKSEIHKFSTASLITRCTNDVNQVQMFIAMGMQAIIKAPILSVWAICKILNKSWQWPVITSVAVVLLLLFVIIVISLCLPKFKRIQSETDDINRVTREGLTGMRIIHAFNAEEYQNSKFNNVNTKLYKTQKFTSKTLSFLMPFMNLLINGMSLAIYWVGSVIIDRASFAEKSILFADMITFMTYSMMILSSFLMLIMVFMLLPRAVVSLKRINDVLSTDPIIKDGKGVNPEKLGTIEFKNVDFKYPDGKENVLSNINLKIEKGETVAFIGATGSGKTTLVDLIPRFYDPTKGEVLIDGENAKDYTLEELHKRVGYVSQKAVLLSGTVVDNITMGHDIKSEDIFMAIDHAQAKEFVSKMENKEDSKIYQGGKNISGGQKQRLSIARAIAKKPEFIIFDDSFSALDYKTDKKLREALNTQLADTTCLIVAQRIGTIKNADKIVVFDDGKIVDVGKHDDLIKNCEVYKQIALSQLSKEEL